jgi:ribonuclease E
MTDAYDSIEAYVSHVAPHLKDRLRRWDKDQDLFAEFRLDEQIAKALERKVFLPSGGSLIIDRTEAMTVIDVNTGKFTGTGGNLESTVTSNNLEAAEEIVRQLRLRDIGGIIVIDFIDMVLPSNRELLLRRLVECLGRDRTRHQVAEITSLGLVQMTRKRIGTGLLEAFTTECPHCHGRGYELHDMPVESHRHADGGVRDSRSRDRRGAAQAAAVKAPEPAISADQLDGSLELAAEERPASRNRRSGRRAAPVPEHDAAEPQDEPAVVS